jgi:cytochrome P450
MNLAGAFIPRGTEWAVDIYNLHRDPSIWRNPSKFDPDRFLAGGEADKQEGIAWAPFNHGQRQCIGNSHTTC